MRDVREYIFKVSVLGNGGVGKTSMVLQYTENKFKANYLMTIGSNFAIKMLRYDENTVCRLQIWDLAGQSSFAFVRPGFYQGSFATIYVFDITDRESFIDIENWVKEADQYVPNVPRVLVGNKLDLTDERVVSRSEGLALAEQLNARYYETSAKTGVNLEKLFTDLNNKLVELHVLNKKSSFQ
ncbi:MAG: GTP-binding protein [Candidatus Lokiarchaeota archaeon]|nr:GTP-binding protein [Candidatus Harpocratesius repetitus]